MRNRYHAGRTYEYRCVHHLRRHGYQAQRTAGSRGPFDIIAWDHTRILMIQVKHIRKPTQRTAALKAATRAWTRSIWPLHHRVNVQAWLYSPGDLEIVSLSPKEPPCSP